MAEALPIVRERVGKGFVYTRAGRRVGAGDVGRIAGLVIPPGWTGVRIAGSAGAKVQAVGVDARGRKQYLYAAGYRARQERAKFSRMSAFAAALPGIRRAARRDLGLAGLPREKVLSAVVLVMDATFIRIGSEEYVKANGSFGLTTLEDRHARMSGGKLVFDFKGKSAVRQMIDLKDPRLVGVVKACKDLPGSQLFQYRDAAGRVRDVKAADVNGHLRALSGEDFTAKDFRTWAGTALACAFLRRCECGGTKGAVRRVVNEAVRQVAGRLGNTPAVCRKSYIAPQVIEAFVGGTLGGLGAGGARLRGGRLSKREEGEIRTFLRKRC